MYNDERVEYRSARQVVRTIKSQLQVKGKSSKCIYLNDNGEIVIKKSGFYAVIKDDDNTLISYNPTIGILSVVSIYGGYAIDL